MSDNRPIAYQENNLSIYRASGAGSCITALVAAKLGYEEARSGYTENILSSAAREGNMHEPAIVQTLIDEYGWRIDGSQNVVELQIIPRVFIRGHVDGLCKPKGKKKQRVLEIKTMSDSVFKQWMRYGDDPTQRLLSDRFMKYAWQISIYMYAYGLPAMYVVKNRNSGVLDIGEIKTPPIDLKTIKTKIIEVERLAMLGDMPPCQASSDDKFFCPYPYLHNGDSVFENEPDDEDEPLDNATVVLLAGMAEKYSDLASQVGLMKPLDDERKALGKKMIEVMGKDGPKNRQAEGWEVKRIDSSNSGMDKVGVAEALGVTFEELDKALKENKRSFPYSYVSVKKMTGE